jgi:hypothetical protein
MCIFSGPVGAVSRTNILVGAVMQSHVVTVRDRQGGSRRVRRPVPDKPAMQLTIYSNTVQLNSGSHGEPTAMILPFPLIKGKNRIKLYDFSKYPKLFKDLDKMFKKVSRGGDMLSFDSDYMAQNSGRLKIHNVGSYKASIVPSYDSFKKLETSKFNMSPSVVKLLAQFYSTGFGFIVCQIRQNASYHPFAYIHEMMTDGKLFVPTKHHHGHVDGNPFKYHDTQTRLPGGEYDDDLDSVNSHMARTLAEGDAYLRHTVRRNSLSTYMDRPKIDWDHSIYVINYSRITRDPLYKKDHMNVTSADPGRIYKHHEYIKLNKFPTSFILPQIKSIHRLNIYAGYPHNHDLRI